MRKTYGWKEEYMIDLIESKGIGWLNKQFRFIREDEYTKWNIIMNIIPIARTPLSKQVGKSLTKADRQIRENLMRMFTPWKNAHEERRKAFQAKYGIKPGEIVVIESSGEAGLGRAIAGDNTVKIVKG